MTDAAKSVFQIAAEASPTGMVVCDEAGRIIFANRQAEDIFGYPLDELVGQPIDVLVPDGQRANHTGNRAEFWQAPATRAMGAGRDLYGLRKDGSTVPVEIGLTVAQSEGRRLVVASVVDVSERITLQNRIVQTNEENAVFERLVADLSARFVNVDADKVGDAISDSIHQISEALDLDRGTWWLVKGGTEALSTYSWTRSEYRVIPTGLSASEVVPWIWARLRQGEIATFNDPADIPSSTDRTTFQQFSAKSAIALPFIVNGELNAVLGFTAIRENREWPPEVVERLRLVCAVFGQALIRKDGQEQLQNALKEVERLHNQLALENTQLLSEVKALRTPRVVVAESAATRKVVAQIEPVASTSATVLLQGETGTGKEVFAQMIHDLSKRHNRPMVRVNCGAIPSALLESELFGRERGAYTGALSRQVGRFEAADGSTLFLDEVGELPLDAQVKLLRVLQDKVIERLGNNTPIKIDVRIIAATNRDLEKAVQGGSFREDLFYRLNVYPIMVPPLRERVEDIPVLVWSFIDQFAKEFGKRIDSISKDSMVALQRYAWPGNVRELRNLVERAVIVATSSQIVLEPPKPRAAAQPTSNGHLTDVEAQHIRSVLDRVGWRVRGSGGAAEILGMKPTTLESRMSKLGIQRAGK